MKKTTKAEKKEKKKQTKAKEKNNELENICYFALGTKTEIGAF